MTKTIRFEELSERAQKSAEKLAADGYDVYAIPQGSGHKVVAATYTVGFENNNPTALKIEFDNE